MDIDETYGIGPDEDDDRPTASDRYDLDRCDRQDHYDNLREERRIANQ